MSKPPKPGQPIAELNVNMSNALVRAAHGLSLPEKRVISCCIAQGDSVPLVLSKSALRTRLHAKDYAETFGLDMTSAYEQMEAAAERIFDRYIRTVEMTPKGPEDTKYRWVEYRKYHKGEGWIELVWTSSVAPHLFGLRREFLSYKLRQAADFRSVYTWRLFECLKSWEAAGRYSPTIEEFTHSMEVPEAYVKNFKELRTRVIEPALRDLKEKNGLLIEWDTRRAGRKVVGLEFRFAKDPQQRLPI